MKKYSLHASKRTATGRKVKQLRKMGRIPGTIYGKHIPSVSLSVSSDDFLKVYKEAGETGLIELTIEGETGKGDGTRPVLVHAIQADPVTNALLHVELHQVDLKEKVRAEVPLEFTGIAPAVEQNTGVLLTIVNDIEVEALPQDLPDKITVDVSHLDTVGQEIKVGELRISKDVTILAKPDLTVVKIGSLTKVEEPVAQPTPQEAAAEAAAGEGTTQAEGVALEEKPKEDTKEEKKKD